MNEHFLMVLEKGPFPKHYEVSGLDWPLPEKVPAEGYGKGAYIKVFESKGPAVTEGDTIRLRGAKYVWDEDAEPYALSE